MKTNDSGTWPPESNKQLQCNHCTRGVWVQERKSETDIRTSLFLWQTSSIHVRKLPFFSLLYQSQSKPSSFSLINHLQSFIQDRLSCFLAAGLTASDKIDLLQSIPNSYTHTHVIFIRLTSRSLCISVERCFFFLLYTFPFYLFMLFRVNFFKFFTNFWALFRWLVEYRDAIHSS